MEDTNSTRCKACDKLFHAVWREEHECFEELCWECLGSALDFSYTYVYDELNGVDLTELGVDVYGDNE